MTKPRDIASIRAGLHRALGLLDEPRIAEVTGKSASLFRKCADPDNPRHRLQMEDALALDAACVAAGGRPPIVEHYRQALDARVASLGGAKRHSAADPYRRIAEAVEELGRVAAAVAASLADRSLTAEDAQRCAAHIERTQDALAALKLDLRDLADAPARRSAAD